MIGAQFNKMSLSRLRGSDIADIVEQSRSERGRERIINHLIEYLNTLETNNGFDDEKVFLVALEFRNIYPKRYRPELRTAIAGAISEEMASIFLSVLDDVPQAHLAPGRQPPNSQDAQRLIRTIKARPFSESTSADIQGFFQRHAAYVARTGDASALMAAFGRIAEAILSLPDPRNRRNAATAITALIPEVIKWLPWSPYLWTLWGRALVAQETPEEGELLYWETIRRFPDDAYARGHLINLLRRGEGNNPAVKPLAHELFELAPNSASLTILCDVLLESGSAEGRQEAVRLLISSISDNPHVYHHLTLMSKALSEVDVNEYEEIVQKLRNNTVVLGRIGRGIRERDLRRAEMFFREALKYHPSNAPLRNQLAGCLASSGEDSKVDEAITILEKTMVDNPTDTYSRNQLAITLVKRGIDKDRLKAIDLLRATQADDSVANEYSEHLLSKILAGEEPDEPTSEPISESVEPVLAARRPEYIVGSHLPPQELMALGNGRRLRFRLEDGEGTERVAAMRDLQELLRSDPTFAYAQLLAVRQAVWERSSTALLKFPAAFELALTEEDLERVNRLRQTHPHLEALTLIAQAVLGDAEAIERVRELLSADDNAQAGLERMIRKQIGPLVVIENERLDEVVVRRRLEIVAKLKEINEWAIGGGDWRLAA